MKASGRATRPGPKYDRASHREPDGGGGEAVFSQSTFIDLCESELRLCALARGESLVVLSQGDERSDYVDAFMAAAQRLGASAMNLRLPYSSSASAAKSASGRSARRRSGQPRRRRGAQGGRHGRRDALPALLRGADRDPEAGTRILTCIEPIDLLARLFPTEELRRRTDVAAELLGGASTLRFTNRAGSDVTYRIGYPVKAQYGFVDQPGGWDHWPSGGLVITGGEDDGVDGRVVVAPGDILLPFKRYVAEPIAFTIEAGRISRSRAAATRRSSASTWPTSTTPTRTGSRTSAGASTSGRSGPRSRPTARPRHGAARLRRQRALLDGPERPLRRPEPHECHLDIPMRNCSLYLDERP